MDFEDHIILEKKFWRVNHRVKSSYPGYLMVQAKEPGVSLSELSAPALSELGHVLKEVEDILKRTFDPVKIIFSKLGFSEGFSSHFHALPVYEWVLTEISNHPDYTDCPDGSDVMLYVNRIYCENQPKETAEDTTAKALQQLKLTIQNVQP